MYLQYKSMNNVLIYYTYINNMVTTYVLVEYVFNYFYKLDYNKAFQLRASRKMIELIAVYVNRLQEYNWKVLD